MSEVEMDKTPEARLAGQSNPSPTPPLPAGEGLDGPQRQDKTPLPRSGEGDGEGAQAASAAPQPEPSWRDVVGDPDLRRQLDRYNSVEDLVRHNLSMRQKLSLAVTLPGEGASDEELADFRTRMGVPERPDDYDYELPGDLPKHLADAISEQDLSDVFDAAHALGLTQVQLTGLLDYRLDALAGGEQRLAGQLAAAREEAEASLRRDWGRDYDRNLNLSRRALRQFGGDGLIEFLTATRVHGAQLANHPEIVKWAASVGRGMTEGTLHLGGEVGGQSPEERRAELTQGIHDARAAGDGAKARELDVERSRLTGELYGNGPIAGE